jgi:hypothetical protein
MSQGNLSIWLYVQKARYSGVERDSGHMHGLYISRHVQCAMSSHGTNTDGGPTRAGSFRILSCSRAIKDHTQGRDCWGRTNVEFRSSGL